MTLTKGLRQSESKRIPSGYRVMQMKTVETRISCSSICQDLESSMDTDPL